MILSNGAVGRFDENDKWIETEAGLSEEQMIELNKESLLDKVLRMMKGISGGVK